MNIPHWLLLTHELPSHPSNIRVRVWRKLQTLGAVPVKNSIYVLPHLPGTREDFDWLRKEIIQMKGDASIFVADTVTDVGDREIVQMFRESRAREFDELIEEIKAFTDKAKAVLEGGHVRKEVLDRLEKHWASLTVDWERLRKIDFFKALNRSKAENVVSTAQNLLQEAKRLSLKESPHPPPQADPESLKSRLWVTRTSPHIDRLACAWLIRRFIDPKARFKFVTEPYRPRGRNELRFDMVEGEFTHFGDWCSFETFLHRLGLKEKALCELAEIIHDIDLKDRKFGRLEVSGVSQIIRGLCKRHKEDMKRLEAGMVIFDSLYAAFTESQGGRK